MVPATLVAGYQRGRNIDIKLLFVLAMGQAYNHTWINVSLTQNTSTKKLSPHIAGQFINLKLVNIIFFKSVIFRISIVIVRKSLIQKSCFRTPPI